MKTSIINFITLWLFSLLFFNVSYAEDTVISRHGPESEIVLDAYLNDFIEEKMKQSSTPGMSFWLYQQDKLDHGRAFGVSNIESAKKVSTDNTVFRIASVSKVFVAIAALQQVEQGKLDLDVDINQYLSLFKVPDYHGMPVTMRQLLVHTAGFESKFWGDSTLREESTESLANHLARRLPVRIREPGKVRAYSNYGSALAAYVVEVISGSIFSDYVKDNILLPAGMTSSSYILSEQLKQQLATGYEEHGGETTAMPYTWVHRYPPTSMLTTAKDMGMFIKMLITDGQGSQGMVLSKNSVKELFRQQFTHDPQLPGMALTFMEMHRFGKKIVWHDGGTVGFQSELVIIPAEKTGYFIVANSKGSSFTGELRLGILERFYNEQPEPVIQSTITIDNIDRFAGNYVRNRINETTFEAFIALTQSGQTLTIDDEGYLNLWEKRYVPIGELRFQREDGKRILAFAETESGDISHMFIDWGGAPRALKKRALLETQLVQGTSLLLSLIIALVVSVLVVIRMKRNPESLKSSGKIALFNSSAPLIFITLFVIGLMTARGGLDVRIADAPFLLAAMTVTLMLVVSVAFSLFKLFTNKTTTGSKLPWIASANAFVFLLWLNQWNLIGYNL